MKRRIFPYPEAIDPGQWTISADTNLPRVNLEKRQLWIPLDDDPSWRTIRAHELAHVAFSDPKTPKKRLASGTFQAVEDCRINHLAAQAGVDFSAGIPPHITEGALLACKHSPKRLCLIALATFEPQRESIMQAIGTLTADQIGVMTKIRDTVSEALYRLDSRYPSAGKGERYSPKRAYAVADWIDSVFPDDWTPDSPSGDREDGPGKGKEIRPKTDCGSGTAILERPPLSIPTSTGRSHRFTDEGSQLIAPWRITTDQRIFRRISIAKAASVLIDASGSMLLEPDDIRAIVKAVPAATIAAYSGEHDSGPLRILAANGRMTADDKAYVFPGGNVIDVPSLQWLASQPRPRYWLCDGVVTGIGDQQSDSVTQACETIRLSAGIVQAKTFADLRKLIHSR